MVDYTDFARQLLLLMNKEKELNKEQIKDALDDIFNTDNWEIIQHPRIEGQEKIHCSCKFLSMSDPVIGICSFLLNNLPQNCDHRDCVLFCKQIDRSVNHIYEYKRLRRRLQHALDDNEKGKTEVLVCFEHYRFGKVQCLRSISDELKILKDLIPMKEIEINKLKEDTINMLLRD